jgi:hypothetical protein
MDTKVTVPKIKPIDHGDLRALLEQAPRQAAGTTVRSRRARERPPVKSTDGRRRRSTGRTKQFNVGITEEVFEMIADTCQRYDLTNREFAERAFLHFIEALKGDKENGLARG